jgi:hypothetical protein
MEAPEYINMKPFKLPEAAKRKQLRSDVIKGENAAPGRPVQTGSGDIKHPQLWQRDSHGGLTYTGRFASDC